MKVNIKNNETGVFAIGGLGEIGKTHMGYNSKMKLSLLMLGSNSQKMIYLGLTT